MNDEEKTREAIDRTARGMYDHAQQRGHQADHSEIRERVRAARALGDRQRENNNR